MPVTLATPDVGPKPPVPDFDPVLGRKFCWATTTTPTDTTCTVQGQTGVTAMTHTGVGTRAAAPIAGKRCAYQETIGAGAGNSGSETTNVAHVRWDFRPKISFLVRAPSALTTRRAWFCIGQGMSATAPLASGSAASGLEHIGLAYDSAVSANWLLQSGDGTNRSGTDTGLAVAVDTDYRIVLDFSVAGRLTCEIWVGANPSGPSVRITKTTNLPTGTTGRVIEWADTNLSGGAGVSGFIRSAWKVESDY